MFGAGEGLGVGFSVMLLLERDLMAVVLCDAMHHAGAAGMHTTVGK